jgi:hypothetical protein
MVIISSTLTGAIARSSSSIFFWLMNLALGSRAGTPCVP